MADTSYTFVLPDRATITPEGAGGVAMELAAHIDELFALLTQLRAIAVAPQEVQTINNNFLDFRDGPTPEPGTDLSGWPEYRQPQGAHDAYSKGRVVRWNDRLFRAVRTGVVHTPSEYPPDWEDVTEELSEQAPPEPPAAAPFVADEAVKPGDLREYNDVVYECIQGHTTAAEWLPPDTPALWKVYQP